jgi:hypothetical protein
MTFDEACQNYDGAIPDDLRKTFIHGGIENYRSAFLRTAERNFSRRFLEILNSVCVWRRSLRYPQEIQFRMLTMLSRTLFQARETALLAWLQLPSNSSASAVIAPPINTA